MMTVERNAIEQIFTSLILGLLFVVLPVISANASANIVHAEVSPAIDSSQTSEQVYGLHGKLRIAVNQPFGSYMDILDGKSYGVVGQSVQIEQQIVAFASMNPSILVKIWGTIQQWTAEVPIMIVSGILADQPDGGAPVATPSYPIAYVQGSIATLRNRPALDGIATAQIHIRSISQTR